MATAVRLFAISPMKPVKQANTPLKKQKKVFKSGDAATIRARN